ncbi:MAG TPA: hypothetical protein VKG92_10295, partial [Flavobacteriales bacterium]|nr:hypothetical protein [Flavobacteriales bacterium]
SGRCCTLRVAGLGAVRLMARSFAGVVAFFSATTGFFFIIAFLGAALPAVAGRDRFIGTAFFPLLFAAAVLFAGAFALVLEAFFAFAVLITGLFFFVAMFMSVGCACPPQHRAAPHAILLVSALSSGAW